MTNEYMSAIKSVAESWMGTDTYGIAATLINDLIAEVESLRVQQETGRYRFYYCESEDSYLLGARVDNFYYAHWDGKSFVWDMSRYLPWGEHIVIPETAWKEHTFPSEPKEIGPDEWFRGFLAQRFQQEAEKNDPLTMDELREMDRFSPPVWDDCLHDWCAVRPDVCAGRQGVQYIGGGCRPLEGGRFYRHKPKEETT